MRKCNMWRIGFLFGLLVSHLCLIACSTQATIPTVSDDPVESLIRTEAARIISVSEDKQHLSEYHILLSDFPRKDVLGMSVGNRRIYISHELAKLASKGPFHLWLLRQTLAHEIAHETSGHARQSSGASFLRGPFARTMSSTDIGLAAHVRVRNYSAEKEFEADAQGLQYWTRLGWVMLRGRAEILRAGTEHDHAQRLLRSRYHQLAAMQIAERPVIAVRLEQVTSWGNLSVGADETGDEA